VQRGDFAYIGLVNAPLYNAQILRLAATIPYQERLASPMATSEKRSPVCGSRVTVDVEVDADGRVSAIGLLVRACALGQASASLMAAEAVGKTAPELAEARDALTAWLAGERPDVPTWTGLELFTPALPHSARHASIRLAFEAVAEAAAAAQASRAAAA
jgi:NifU-like protein involved in Fe-S cluster formation